MKVINYYIYIISLIIVSAFSGCGGELISELKDFEANNAPDIQVFVSDIADGTEILPNMLVNFTVTASDIEGDEIQYSFASDYGTFRKLERTATGCTIQFFISSTCPTSESIPVTLNASDDKNGSSGRTLDIGDGRGNPSITCTWPTDTELSSGDTAQVTFSADCTGYYQVRIQSPAEESIVFNQVLESFFYERGDIVTLDIKAGTGSGIDFELTSTGEQKLYIVLFDNFRRQADSSAVFTVN